MGGVADGLLVERKRHDGTVGHQVRWRQDESWQSDTFGTERQALPPGRDGGGIHFLRSGSGTATGVWVGGVRSTRRRILPVDVFGNSSRTSTMRGYL